MTENTLGKRLLRLRTRKGYTQKYVGNHVYVTSVAVSQWETGKRRPGYEELISLANLYGVSINYFFMKEVDKWVKKILNKLMK